MNNIVKIFCASCLVLLMVGIPCNAENLKEGNNSASSQSNGILPAYNSDGTQIPILTQDPNWIPPPVFKNSTDQKEVSSSENSMLLLTISLPWPQFHMGTAKQGASTGNLMNRYIGYWTSDGVGAVRSSVVMCNSTIVVASEQYNMINSRWESSLFFLNTDFTIRDYYSYYTLQGTIRATPTFDSTGNYLFVIANPESDMNTGTTSLFKFNVNTGSYTSIHWTASGVGCYYAYSGITYALANPLYSTTNNILIMLQQVTLLGGGGYSYKTIVQSWPESLSAINWQRMWAVGTSSTNSPPPGLCSMSSPAMLAGTHNREIYIGVGSTFYALHESDGSVEASYNLGGPILTSPTVDTSHWPYVYIVSNKNGSTPAKIWRFYGYHTLSFQWSRTLDGDYASSPANWGNLGSTPKGSVYVSTYGTNGQAHFYRIGKDNTLIFEISKSYGGPNVYSMVPSPFVCYLGAPTQLQSCSYFVDYNEIYAYDMLSPPTETKVLSSTQTLAYDIYSSPCTFITSDNAGYMLVGQDGFRGVGSAMGRVYIVGYSPS